ncbi:MAG: SDR family oxidoreductase [Bacteroidales bacterium]
MGKGTVLITGSTDGIGFQTATDLIRAGYRVIIHGRNLPRLSEAAGKIEKLTGVRPEGVTGDLSSLQEVRTIADQIFKITGRLDMLVNNAGVFSHERRFTNEGFELTWGVNHLAHFLLSGLLMPLLMEHKPGRLVQVASMAHASSLDFSNLQGERYYDGFDAYQRSKLCNILFVKKLSRMVPPETLETFSLHPGVIATKLLHQSWGPGGDNLETGAGNITFLAPGIRVKAPSGSYFVNRKPARPAPAAHDTRLQDRLWSLSEKLSGFSYNFS